jgi:hypothetical protein
VIPSWQPLKVRHKRGRLDGAFVVVRVEGGLKEDILLHCSCTTAAPFIVLSTIYMIRDYIYLTVYYHPTVHRMLDGKNSDYSSSNYSVVSAPASYVHKLDIDANRSQIASNGKDSLTYNTTAGRWRSEFSKRYRESTG